MKQRDWVLMASNHEELDRCPVQISSVFEFASMGPLTDTTIVPRIPRKR
jgi:hypothetical protein